MDKSSKSKSKRKPKKKGFWYKLKKLLGLHKKPKKKSKPCSRNCKD